MKLNPLIKIIVLCCLPTFGLKAQEKAYAIVTFVQLSPAQSVEDYLAVEKLRARLHQKAADQGFHKGWFLHRIDHAGAAQFAAIEIHPSLDSYAKGPPASLQEGLFSPEELAQLKQAESQRARTEIWEISTAAKMRRQGGPPAKLDVHFLRSKPGKDEAYRQFEGVSKSVHQARINTGHVQSWTHFRRFAPTGTDIQYNYVTFTGYSDRDAVDDKLTSPDSNEAEPQALRNADDIRAIVSRETWIPVLHVLPFRR